MTLVRGCVGWLMSMLLNVFCDCGGLGECG